MLFWLLGEWLPSPSLLASLGPSRRNLTYGFVSQLLTEVQEILGRTSISPVVIRDMLLSRDWQSTVVDQVYVSPSALFARVPLDQMRSIFLIHRSPAQVGERALAHPRARRPAPSAATALPDPDPSSPASSLIFTLDNLSLPMPAVNLVDDLVSAASVSDSDRDSSSSPSLGVKPGPPTRTAYKRLRPFFPPRPSAACLCR